MALINIDMKGVVAELKGIRAALEKIAAAVSEPEPDDESQAIIDELTEATNKSSDSLAAELPGSSNQ